MKRLLFLVLFGVFLYGEVIAMKPAPFSAPIEYKDPVTHVRLKSSMDKGNDGYGFEGVTEVTDSKGKLLWKVPVFIGRKKFYLSPTGDTLVLYGDFYFTSVISQNGDFALAEVISAGKTIKKVNFSELYSKFLKQLVSDFKISVEGGGWVPLEEFVKDFVVDWPAKTLKFTLRDKSVKKMSW